MPVYNNLKAVRKLTNSSLTSIIDITNLNFTSLSSANLEFLNNIKYDETLNTFQVYSGMFDFVNITDKLSLTLDGIPTFTIDSLGRAEGQQLLVKVAETKRQRFTDFNDWPEIGVPGEIIYTGIQNQRPEFGEDFIGYLQSRGWVSLTEPNATSFLTLYELAGSPPVPACPAINTGIIWVGPLGYETATVATTQTLYYTDENCNIYDLTGAPQPPVDGIITTSVSIASADELNLGTTPYLLIASPGAGYFIQVLTAACNVDFNTTTYAVGTTLVIQTDTANRSQHIFNNALNATLKRICVSTQQGTFNAADTQLISDKGVYLTSGGSTPTLGDSDIIIYLTYRIIQE